MENRIEAVVIGSSIRFTVTKALAVLCLHCVGNIIYHDQLGPLLCTEIRLCPDDGSIREVLFQGTADPTRFL